MDSHNELRDSLQDETFGSDDEQILEPTPFVNIDAQNIDDINADVENAGRIDGVLAPRPLDLADGFEVVRGVPAFVWRDSFRFKSDYKVFALSPDGAKMALMEADLRVKLYDVLDNFSVLAEGQVIFDARVCCLCFGNMWNNEIIAVHEDSCVTSFSIDSCSIAQSRTCAPFVEHRIPWHEHRFRMQFRDSHKLHFAVKTQGAETWICAYDLRSPTVINIYSRLPRQHRIARIRPPRYFLPSAAYVAIPQRAFMMVGCKQDAPETMTTLIWREVSFETLIWRDIDYERHFVDHGPTEIEGRGFGWSDCGNYLVVWKSNSLALFHGTGDMERSVQPISSTPIGDEIHYVHCQFLTLNQVAVELGLVLHSDAVPIVAYLAASSSSLKLFFWNPFSTIIRREFDLTVRGMVLPHDAHCEFCLSSNLRWVAVGCWTSGRFGLFSLATGTWAWNLNLNASDLRRCPCDLLRFDVSGTKLFVNSAGALHVFAPPCLVEDHRIIMEATVYDLTILRGENAVQRLRQDHQGLIPKYILRRMFAGMSENLQRRLVDVAKSVTTSSVAMLVQARLTAFILLSQLQNFLTPNFRNYAGNDFTVCWKPESIEVIDIGENFGGLQYNDDRRQVLVFLYPNLQGPGDSIVVFTLDECISALFLDGAARNLTSRRRLADPAQWLDVKQSKDGFRALCMKEYGVVIIDLNTRTILQSVHYQASISHWLSALGHPREASSVDVSDDGATIVVGFDVKKKKLVCLSNDMSERMAAYTLRKCELATHCWALEQDLGKLAFLHFNPLDNSLSAVGVYHTKNDYTRIVGREQWYPFVSRVLNTMLDNESCSYGLQLDKQTGHLWLIAVKQGHEKSELVFVPIGPHTIKDCLPHLDMSDYPQSDVTLPEIERFVEDYGTSYFYMPMNGETNLDLMMNIDSQLMDWRLLSLASTNGIALDPAFRENLFNSSTDNLLEAAIEESNELMAKFFLERITQRPILSVDNACLLKQCFSGLWTNFSTIITSVLQQNLVALDVCNVEISADAFNCEDNLVTRLGTCNELSAWQNSSEEGTSFAYWRTLNQKKILENRGRGKMARVRGQLKVFGIADVCKIGLKGILRTLLMQRVPARIFKTQLVKWVLIWKWENIWKRRCLRHVFAYAMYGFTVVVYTAIVGYSTSTFSPISQYFSLDNLLLLVLILSSFFMLYREYRQLRTYVLDGKRLRPNDRLFGVKYYLRSRCNALEVTTYLFSLVVIPTLHLLSCYNSAYLSVLYRLVVILIFAICAKIWYYATAFQPTGVLVLTVQSVIRYSLPFLALAGVVIVAFGISLFVLFEHLLQESEGAIDELEIRARIEVSFGTPFKSILTLFYAMLGAFDHEIFSSDYISTTFITATFVFYLIIQLIIVLNMLVAVMTCTFDRVKDTEEEELCIGRARLIDAYEAMLGPQQIAKLDELSQKYLHVIYPLDKEYEDEPTALKGTPSTLEKHMTQLVRRSQDQLKGEIINATNQAILETESRIDETLARVLDRMDALLE